MIDAYTDTWRGIAAKLNEIVEASRSRMEQHDQSYGETQFLRGRIAVCREILDLVKPREVIVNPTPEALRPRDRSGI